MRTVGRICRAVCIAAALGAGFGAGTLLHRVSSLALEMTLAISTGVTSWLLVTGRRRGEVMAERMTRDLATAMSSAAEREAELRAFREAISGVAIVSETDARGRITSVNELFCSISGYRREELIGQDHRIVNSGTHDKAFWVDAWRTIAGGNAWRGQVCNRAKDGRLYWVDSVITPMRGGVPGEQRYLSIRFDITAQKQAEQRAQPSEHSLRAANAELALSRHAADAANRSKSEFLANMSHEIRTPLTAILGYAEVLREDGDEGKALPRRNEAIDTIRNAGQHLLSVINDILDLSKIEAGRMEVERVRMSLTGVLREVESLCRPRAAMKGVELSVALQTPVPEFILSDPTRMRQILMNLVGNAVKFTEEGAIAIRVRVETSRLVIEVADTGAGMSAEGAAQLFRPFSQADSTVTRKHGGTGLGLTISRRLAGLMGGDVRLVRSELGRGSTFEVNLPLCAGEESAMVQKLDVVRSQPVEKSAVALRGRILLAEDGVDNQRLIAFHLRNAGAEVDIADNGRVALEMIEASEVKGAGYDLLITDVQMPEMDGYSLARTLRARDNKMGIVALTAHAMAEDREKCLDAGCDDFASKPIDKASLLKVCETWLNGAAMLRRAA